MIVIFRKEYLGAGAGNGKLIGQAKIIQVWNSQCINCGESIHAYKAE